MSRINKNGSEKTESVPAARQAEYESAARWRRLCEVYLPCKAKDSFWRFSRESRPEEPAQGWKLHVSATILEACDLFERAAPYLLSRNVRFKAPDSLAELVHLNSGLKYGYWQVGKFLTVYPPTAQEAVEIAGRLHELTKEFIPVSVPFDNQYLPQSSVFYRYGAFEELTTQTADGTSVPAIRNSAGALVYDDRLRAVPEGLSDPFQSASAAPLKDEPEEQATPFVATYKVFRAVTQRGKGGTYQALDLTTTPPRLCIVKEGRRYGEVFWNGQDGYHLVRNEEKVLRNLGKIYQGVPRVFASFEAHGNFYLVMEYVEGESLAALMKLRQRRFSVKQVLGYAAEIAGIIEEIHRAGWVWNDCKPSNLIVTSDGSLRPLDFEGACAAGEPAAFNWKSREFSKPGKSAVSGAADDLYALGAVLYFLLTGKFYDSRAPTPLGKLRRGVPEQLKETIERLLSAPDSKKIPAASAIRKKLARALDSVRGAP